MNFELFYTDYLKKLQAYQLAFNTISFEQYTIAPKDGIDYSNEMLAILSKEAFQIENNPDTIQKMKEYYNRLEDGLEKKEIQYRLEAIADSQSIPSDVYGASVKLAADSMMKWHEAKEKDNYEIFKPYLKQVVESQKQLISYSPRFTGNNTYDLLLDKFEKGMNQEKYDAFFEKIKENIIPFIQKIKESGTSIDDSFMHKTFSIERQEKFMDTIGEFLKIDKNKVYLSTTEHPFTSSFSHGDARITTHYYPDSFLSAILSTVHEYGHALYGLQVNPEFEGTMFYEPLCAAHESQSRFLENHIGRSKAFWQANYKDLIEQFPEFKDVTVDALVNMINKTECSLIRTEADELTYPLHVLIRYEIEKEIFAGNVDYDTLPTLWNDKYEQYLGIRPNSDATGILQDVHWSDGSFGYFPSYALGSAYAAQLYRQLEKEVDVQQVLENNQFEVIANWLKENVHMYGNSKSMEEIVEIVTKEPFNPDYYIQYLIDKYSKLYQLK